MNGTGSVTARGDWPGLVTLRAGWWKGVARPLNDDSVDAVLRVERASTEFVRRCATTLIDMGARSVHSPPTMRGSDKMFRTAGFEHHLELLLLERDLRRNVPTVEGVRTSTDEDRRQAVRIDSLAFEGDWRVGELGLADALGATPDSIMLTLDGGEGFAIVGVSNEISYLQRIAVEPESQSAGLGRLLLRSSMAWARSRGARTMMLNTQLDNERATHMYRSESFTVLPNRLSILRFES
jgi:[ribosomal protein S18]-alanine N-acetyltransferase